MAVLPWPRDGVLCVCPHRDSCQRGWRLLYILTAYHSCSEVLRPPFVHFLQDVSQSPGLPFQGEGHSKGARAAGLSAWVPARQPAGGEIQRAWPFTVPGPCSPRFPRSPDVVEAPQGLVRWAVWSVGREACQRRGERLPRGAVALGRISRVLSGRSQGLEVGRVAWGRGGGPGLGCGGRLCSLGVWQSTGS